MPVTDLPHVMWGQQSCNNEVLEGRIFCHGSPFGAGDYVLGLGGMGQPVLCKTIQSTEPVCRLWWEREIYSTVPLASSHRRHLGDPLLCPGCHFQSLCSAP